ncbi:lysozyme inhibitor LprI family protein [Ancylobacter sp. SL191]|uniref:lysozyme inhibitor LprI family protein n=1 Tax=Ancylobacter sp. SL191 TaxID=2995166 RepID=UPI00226D8755|nr:lysozyme inhibitor LprI family protein [Ancylobacter sp. SL191]WAC28999.1 DUF1311 domain-containing protein [Ancylobacter sp. SL191]
MRGALLLGFALVISLPALAQDSEPAACARGEGSPRAHLDCLNRRQDVSEARLQAALSGARAAIAAREDLQPPQRARWTSLFNESQERFTHWRNFECQSIAPYEGGAGQKTVGGRLGGIGVIEQRLVCLATLNDARAGDLEARYALPAFLPPPPGPAAAAPTEPTPVAPASGTTPSGAMPPSSVPSIMAPPVPESPAEAPPPSGPVRIIGIPPTQP